MCPRRYPNLNAEKALIWRIIHRDNLPWVLQNGLHAGNSTDKSPEWISIGSQDLIDKRANHPVPLGPGGVLNDYVPFYFTPFSPMLLNIRTGRAGITKRSNEEIVILVSSIPHLTALGISYLFTDRHAYVQLANYYEDPNDLAKIDWGILQARDFKRDPDDPGKLERYQAEVLVHGSLPVEGLLGIVCFTAALRDRFTSEVQAHGLELPVYAKPDWYFE